MFVVHDGFVQSVRFAGVVGDGYDDGLIPNDFHDPLVAAEKFDFGSYLCSFHGHTPFGTIISGEKCGVQEKRLEGFESFLG